MSYFFAKSELEDVREGPNYGSLSAVNGDPIPSDTQFLPRKSQGIRFVPLLLAVVLLSALGAILTNPSIVSLTSFETTKTTKYASALGDDFSFTLHRSGYGALTFFATNHSALESYLTYSHLGDYVGVIEPYVPMNLHVTNLDQDASYKFRYTACEVVSSVVSDSCSFGEYSSSASRTLELDCEPFDEYELTVTQYDTSTDEVLGTSSGRALCQYVRRDIGSLTDDDLQTAMDAMYTLWSVSDGEGKKLYGNNFHTSLFFAEAHLFNAAQRDADHIHEGLGFLTQHIKITNMYEEALQAVDPSVSLFYWDYTYESGDLAESLMFTADTFGTITKSNLTREWTYEADALEEAAIPDGRWAKLEAETSNKYTDLTNAYGFLRGPWNTNPSPFISRFVIDSTSLPSCTAFSKMFEIGDLDDFLTLAPFAPHASTHGGIGGVFGCDVFQPLLADGLLLDDASRLHICKKWSIIMKELYRSNFVSPQVNCTVDSYDLDGIHCGYLCDDEYADTMTNNLKALITTQYVPDDITDEQWSSWRDFVCSGDAHKVYSGDHLEAASPSDPSFWPIHPNLERLLQAKIMVGGFTNADWPSSAIKVCEKYKCYEEDYGDKDEYSECCVGHFEDDQLLDFVSGKVKQGYGPTNGEVMDWTSPANASYAMPYIYDDFSWSHCGTEFATMMLDLAEGTEQGVSASSLFSDASVSQEYWVVGSRKS